MHGYGRREVAAGRECAHTVRFHTVSVIHLFVGVNIVLCKIFIKIIKAFNL